MPVEIIYWLIKRDRIAIGNAESTFQELQDQLKDVQCDAELDAEERKFSRATIGCMTKFLCYKCDSEKKVLEQGGQANAALTEKTPIPAVSQVYSNCYAPG